MLLKARCGASGSPHEQAQRNSVTQRNTNCHAAPEGTITTFISTQPRSSAPNTPTETQHQPLATQRPLYRLAHVLHVQKCARVAQGVVPAAGVTMGGGGRDRTLHDKLKKFLKSIQVIKGSARSNAQRTCCTPQPHATWPRANARPRASQLQCLPEGTGCHPAASALHTPPTRVQTAACTHLAHVSEHYSVVMEEGRAELGGGAADAGGVDHRYEQRWSGGVVWLLFGGTCSSVGVLQRSAHAVAISHNGHPPGPRTLSLLPRVILLPHIVNNHL